MYKRIFDFIFSLVILILFCWIFIIVWSVSMIATNSPGFFIQQRVGRYGKLFNIYKFRTIDFSGKTSNVTQFLRRSKLDELPQLVNILLGTMSLVGPRPDLPGYYDLLEGESRKILQLRPGITSEASIKYKNEEALLATHSDPMYFNDYVIFPDKVRMNLEYYYNHSFWIDIKILWKTLLCI